jgi:hypothetical protein
VSEYQGFYCLEGWGYVLGGLGGAQLTVTYVEKAMSALCWEVEGMDQRLRTPSCVVQTLITQTLSQANPPAITAEEYFNPNFELGNRAMGRPMELTTKTQK